jgi:hypothetical protein
MIIILSLLQDNWIGVIHHVAGEHEWGDGECNHGPLVAAETGRIFLKKDSKALEAIRRVVLDPQFLKSLASLCEFQVLKMYWILLRNTCKVKHNKLNCTLA